MDEQPDLLGKDYDVFFIYHAVSSVRHWVRHVMSRLEMPQYGFKCCVHERDFVAGKAIVDNIVTSLCNTMKVIVVFSQDCLTSQWFRFELEMAFSMSVDVGGDLTVIPVILQQCTIPDMLKNLTYLEIIGSEDYWFPRILKAVSDRSINPQLVSVDFTEGYQMNLTTIQNKMFEGRTETDAYKSWLTSIEFTPAGDLILTDTRNKKLKLFDLSGRLKTEKNFESRPHSLAFLDDQHFIVSFPDETCAYVMTLIDDNISMEREIDVPHQCAGVAKLDDQTFVLACRSHKSIIAMNISGETLFEYSPEIEIGDFDHDAPQDSDEEFYTVSSQLCYSPDKNRNDKFLGQKSRKSLFVFPTFVAALGKEKIFLTDHGTKSLHIISNDNGDFSCRSVGLLNPRGMLVIEEYLIVADNNIKRFSFDGQSEGSLKLHGIDIVSPRSMTVDTAEEYAAVTHKGILDDYVTIYSILN